MLSMWLRGCVVASTQQNYTRLFISRLGSTVIYKRAIFRSHTIFQQPTNTHRYGRFRSQIKATLHIIFCKLFRQTIESFDGFRTVTNIRTGLAILIIKVSLSHGAKIVSLTSVLDIHNQLSQFPIHIVRLEFTIPILAILLHLIPMSHHDKRRREVQTVISTALKAMLPVASVLTIPAAGSEMSEASVITNEDGDVKLGYSNNMSRPKFAIMNPRRTMTLPPYQTAAGVTDMMMHTMERYFTKDDDMDFTTDLAEAALRNIKEAVFAVLKNPEDYRYRAQIMWGGSLMHNGLTGCGVSDDWATHQLEHELSGMFDVTHGAGLAAIWPSWARYVMHENLRRFVRFAVNVMDVPNDFTDPEGTALKGIEAMERFYHAIGMPINIKELIGKDISDEEIKEMTRKCSRDYTSTCGCLKVLKAEDMEAIYKMARG